VDVLGGGITVPDKKQAQFQRVEVPTGLSIDSPMVIFHTDLDALGLTGVVFSPGGGSSPGGGEPPGGGTSGGDTPPPTSQTDQVAYIAMCDRVQHTGGAGDGVINGTWFGVYSTNLDEAQASALAHEDGLAFVAFYLHGVLVGPVAGP
jgi:hypothetical protein